MKLFRLGCVAMCLCLTVSVVAADETIESLESKLKPKWKEIKSLSATMVMTTTMPGMSMKMEGPYEFMSKDDKQMFRMETKMQQAFGDTKMETSALYVCDGDTMFMLTDSMGQKSCMKMKPDASQMQSPASENMFQTLGEQMELSVGANEKVDDKDAYVVIGKPKAQASMPGVTQTKLYFDQKTGMMVKMVGLGADGGTVMEMTYKDVKLNPTIAADRFKFEVPEGVQVMDMTGQ